MDGHDDDDDDGGSDDGGQRASCFATATERTLEWKCQG